MILPLQTNHPLPALLIGLPPQLGHRGDRARDARVEEIREAVQRRRRRRAVGPRDGAAVVDGRGLGEEGREGRAACCAGGDGGVGGEG